MPEEAGGTAAPSAPDSAVSPGNVQGAIAVRMDATPAPASTGKTDAPWPGDAVPSPQGQAVREKWFGKQVPPWEASAALKTQEAEAQAQVATPAVTQTPTDVYANTADLNTPTPELLEMARNFAPVLEQFKQQGFANADALTAAQAKIQADTQLEQQQIALYNQYDALVNEGKLDSEMAERLFTAEARAMTATHQAQQIMQQAGQQAQKALLQQVQTQYPRLPAETITQVMGAVPGEAGAKLLGQLSAQIDTALEQAMTRQATASAAAQATAAARAAGAASSAPGAGQGQTPGKKLTWVDHFVNMGMKPPVGV